MLTNISYTKNYIRIYIVQFISILVGFASIFVVVPHISADPSIYGIYSICTSITIFLSYADFGFLGAGAKFAAEHYARAEKEKEIEILGFTHFIFLLVVIILSAIFGIFSYNPTLLIKDIQLGTEMQIAKRLLLILAISSPVVVFQRMMQIVFSVRLQDYKVQRVITLGNVLKILMIYIFFSNDKYDIVGYYLCFNIINILTTIINIFQAKLALNIGFKDILTSFKFNINVFKRVKDLAFSTFVGSILWVIFYELDTIVIGRTLGARSVAMYSVGLTVLNLIRSMLGVFFTPFNSRFNHFIAFNQDDSLKAYILHIHKIMFFITVFPLITLSIFSKPFVLSWLGLEYQQAIPVVALLVLCNLLAFIQYPIGNLMIAKQKIKYIYITNLIPPIMFWLGVLLTVKFIGIYSFAVFKLLSFIVIGCIYWYYALKFLKISFLDFFKYVVKPYIPALLISIFCSIISVRYITFNEKSFLNLVLCILIIVAIIVIDFVISLFCSYTLRDYFFKIIYMVKKH